jgi:O-antigen/teichoic acid export membrane protein
MDRIGKSVMNEGPVTLVVMAVLMYFTRNLVVAVTGLVIVWALQLVCYDFYSGVMIFRAAGRDAHVGTRHTSSPSHELIPRFNKERLQQLVRSSLPLGFAAMLISLNATVPRYFISKYAGNDQLGIFAAMAYIMTAEMVLVNTLAQAAVPRLGEYYASGNLRQFLRLMSRLIGFGIAVGGLGVLIASVKGQEILTVLYQPQYAVESVVLVILMFAALTANIASFLNFGMVAVRALDVQVPLFIGVTFTAAVSSIYLIPAHGLAGAAIALIGTYLVQSLGGGAIIARAISNARQLKIINKTTQ